MSALRQRFDEAQTADLRRAAVTGVLVVLGTLAGARLVLMDWIRTADEALFAKIVPWLQTSDTLVSTSGWLTDMGSKNVAYTLIFPIAIYLTLAKRQPASALLALFTLIAALGLQSLTFASVTGTTPTEFVIGTGGPFYSGGVVRAMVMAGLLVTAITRRDRFSDNRVVWATVLVVGSIEGFTRLVLGRHWPLDIIAAIPIGLGITSCHLATERWLASMRTDEAATSPADTTSPEASSV